MADKGVTSNSMPSRSTAGGENGEAREEEKSSGRGRHRSRGGRYKRNRYTLNIV